MFFFHKVKEQRIMEVARFAICSPIYVGLTFMQGL